MRSKNTEPNSNLTRRGFIRRANCAAVGTWALSSTIRDLRLINAALATGSFSDYKALVCVFLSGGNDSNNWIVPTDTTTYNEYASIRGNLALPLVDQGPTRPGLLPLYSTGTTPYQDADGHTYGFHPTCGKLQTLFNTDKLAIVMNVGTLVRPTTKAQYNAVPTFYRPPQLFSHSDQVTQWQTSIPDQPPTTGWGGRVADLLNATANPSGNISMSVSLNGANTFEVGNLVTQYHVSTTGAITLANAGTGGGFMGATGARAKALRDILALNHVNLQRTAFREVMESAIVTGQLLNDNIAASADPFWTVAFPNTTLGNQLKMVARLIHARNAFNMKRQIFFCSVGGYDTHTAQVTDPLNSNNQFNPTTGTHTTLLNEVSESLWAFQKAMEQIGTLQGDPDFDKRVTTFTASDFSRTFPTNSLGSDHAWGAHHIIMGGAVKGGQTYGKLPIFALNGPDDTGTGRYIPTLAVDQYSATLAKWFGVSPGSEMAAVFPNLSRFDTSDLGFML